MNKQEAIELIEKLEEHYGISEGIYLEKRDVINIISKIHEPQKVTIPKFVADWIEECKRDKKSLYYALESSGEVNRWLDRDDKLQENEDIFARAWLDGYEVEKEKLYTVEIPNPNLNTHTILQKIGKGLALIMVTNARWKGWESSKLTEAEIKQNFEWAWRWAEEV